MIFKAVNPWRAGHANAPAFWSQHVEKKASHFYCLVTKSCPTLCDPMDYSPPGPSVHGLLQAIKLEWVTISFSRGPSWPRYWAGSPVLQADGCDSWIIKKMEHRRIDTFELVLEKTLERSNQSILREINPEYSFKDWYWSQNSSILVISYEQLIH